VKRRRYALGVAALALVPVVALVLAAALTPLPPELAQTPGYGESIRFVDRDGALLREVRAKDGARAQWLPLSDLGDNARRALLAAEDTRFELHPGVDPLAVVRAVVSAIVHGRVTSGASTITMQLARLVRPHPRTLRGKLGEMALALRIEASLSKARILEEYANRAPFGPQLRGIEAASRYWFDKPTKELSLAEAATLASLPRGPDLYAPARHPERALRRRDRVLARMRGAGWITERDRAQAVAEPLLTRVPRGSFGAPHLVQALCEGQLGAPPIRGRADLVETTIARDLQREAEIAAAGALGPLADRHVTEASVIAIDNATGEVMAYVGAPDVRDGKNGGWNDGVRALRQPGSTLKPFVYGLAMEQLGFTAATVLPDVELHIEVPSGVYTPLDYDERYHGPVRLREALGSSLNVPAAWTADRLGAQRVLERLHAVGLASLGEDASYYGPAIALGDGEVSLFELANAYAALARGGVWRPAVTVRSVRSRDGVAVPTPAAAERRVFPRAVADVITDILADPDARLAAFGDRSALDLPFPVAAKTGTSKRYRDNWTIGYTREVTVGVWVGNFDGTAMAGVSGITGAAPLFRAVMEAAMRARSQAPLRLDGARGGMARVAVCPLSGGAPTPACQHVVHEWLPAGKALAPCGMHERRGDRTFERFPPEYAAWAKGAHRDVAPEASSPRADGDATRVSIAWPRPGARLLVDPGRPRALQAVEVRAVAPSTAPRVALRVDGKLLATPEAPFVASWTPTRGEHVFEAEAPGLARSEPVRVVVE
jgi:penicillin-binding protein 1C